MKREVPSVAPESVEAKRLLLALPTWTDEELCFFFGLTDCQLDKWARREHLECYSRKVGERRIWHAKPILALFEVVPDSALPRRMRT